VVLRFRTARELAALCSVCEEGPWTRETAATEVIAIALDVEVGTLVATCDQCGFLLDIANMPPGSLSRAATVQ
jgi:hypothetical protein